MRNKILRSTNAKYHYSYLSFYKMNKGDLSLMYPCVFWCGFIDLVGFFGCYCLTPVTLFIIRGYFPSFSLFPAPPPFSRPTLSRLPLSFALSPLSKSLEQANSLVRELSYITTEVAQVRNMSIGEHRHCCVTFKI